MEPSEIRISPSREGGTIAPSECLCPGILSRQESCLKYPYPRRSVIYPAKSRCSCPEPQPLRPAQHFGSSVWHLLPPAPSLTTQLPRSGHGQLSQRPAGLRGTVPKRNAGLGLAAAGKQIEGQGRSAEGQGARCLETRCVCDVERHEGEPTENRFFSSLPP